jgi:hypothetical protein
MGALGRSTAGRSDLESFCMSSMREMLFRVAPVRRKNRQYRERKSGTRQRRKRTILSLELSFLPTECNALVCDEADFDLWGRLHKSLRDETRGNLGTNLTASQREVVHLLKRLNSVLRIFEPVEIGARE